MPTRTVLILGGGVGGVVAATRLRTRLPRTDRVVLVDREDHHLFQPSLLWVATGRRRAEQIRRPLARLARRGIEVIQAEVEAIDPAQRTVRAGGRELTADAIVVALGAELGAETIPGLREAGHDLYTLRGAETVHEQLRAFPGGRVVVLTATPAYKCPAAPYEAAMLTAAFLRGRGLADRSTVAIFAAEPGPMVTAGQEVSTAVLQMVEGKGIGYHPFHQVTSVDPTTRTIAFANDATTSFDLLLYVPPHRAPAPIRASALAGAMGWVEVDRRTFATSFPGVYAIGDVTTVPLSIGRPLPKAGVFAHRQAEVVAANIAAEWAGRPAAHGFDGHGECFLETGDEVAGLGYGNFYGEPAPAISLRRPARWWWWAKVAFERWWYWRWA